MSADKFILSVRHQRIGETEADLEFLSGSSNSACATRADRVGRLFLCGYFVR